MPPPTSDPSWKAAWDDALYGAAGFFRRESPAAHFRTSVHASPLFARALVRLVREAGGTVLAQDRETSVIWGMPGAVAGAGTAHAVLTPTEIGRLIAARAGTPA